MMKGMLSELVNLSEMMSASSIISTQPRTTPREFLYSLFLSNNRPRSYLFGLQDITLQLLTDTFNSFQCIPFDQYKNYIESFVVDVLKQNAKIIVTTIPNELSHDERFMLRVVKHQVQVHQFVDTLINHPHRNCYRFNNLNFDRLECPFDTSFWGHFSCRAVEVRSRLNNKLKAENVEFLEEVKYYHEKVLKFLTNDVLVSDSHFMAKALQLFPQLARGLTISLMPNLISSPPK